VQLWSLLYAKCTEMDESLDASGLGGRDDGGGTDGVDALEIGAVVPVTW